MIEVVWDIKERLALLEDKVDRMLQWGVVDSVDVDAARVVVAVGDLKSRPLPWACTSGRAFIPPVAGEQCLLVAPHGEMAMGVVLVGISKKDEGRGDKDVIVGALTHDRLTGEVALAEGDKLLALAELVDAEFNKIASAAGVAVDSLSGPITFEYVPASVAATKVKGQ